MLPATRFAALPPHVVQAAHSVTAPRGFRASGISAGIKGSNRLDLGILVSDEPCVSATMMTVNAVAAAPVQIMRSSCDCDHLRAIVVNSGNANACSGTSGVRDALRMRQLAAAALELPESEVAVCSTGVIGVPLPMPKIEAGIEKALENLSPENGDHFAAAIRTTDRTSKHGELCLSLSGGEVRIGCAAKGAGMISPTMATMLCYLTCDAIVTEEDWRAIITSAVSQSFNRITVDGQASTNDTVIALANGASGVRPAGDELELLSAAIHSICLSLAVAIVADGEGATKAIRLSILGAADDVEAEAVARAVGNSPLIKAAFYGEDPNWGRVAQTVGQTLCAIEDKRSLTVDIDYGSLRVLDGSLPVEFDKEAKQALRDLMASSEIDLVINLHRGESSAILYFSDLTHQYVTFNAEYTT